MASAAPETACGGCFFKTCHHTVAKEDTVIKQFFLTLWNLLKKGALYIVDGIVIGMAVMIPGVSGGSMIMSMGLYPSLIALIGGSNEERKKTLPVLIPVVIGLLCGVVAFSYILKLALASYPLQTAMVFIGLILGGIPMLFSHVRGTKLNGFHVLAFLVAAAVMVAMLIFSARANLDLSLKPSVWHFVLTIVLGFLSSSTMIIPGVSGSALMLILGYYYEITGRVKALSEGIRTLSWPAIGENLLVFLPYLIGAALGIFLTSKGIKKLLDRHPVTTYWALLGLMVTSPVAVLAKVEVQWAAVSVPGYLAAAVCLAAGFAVAFFLGRREN